MGKIIVIFTVITLLFTHCINNEYIYSQPIIILVVNDLSKSADQNQVPKLDEENINTLVGLLKGKGGSINYLPLTANSFIPITRLELEPYQGKSLKQRAVLSQKQKDGIESFKKEVTKSITSGRSARKTDLWGAIKRTELLFNEAPKGRQINKKILLLVSDGIDDAKKYQPTTLSNDITVILVGNRGEQVKRKIGKKVLEFEGMNSAIKYIEYLAKGESNEKN